MDSLIEYIELLVPVALVLLFVLQRVFFPEEGEETRQRPSVEQDEEARRIQEEIRRKIIARQQGRSQPEREGADEAPYDEEPPPPPVAFPRYPEEPSPIHEIPWERPIIVEAPPPRETRAFRETASGVSHDIQDELRAQQQRLQEARRAKEDALKQSLEKGLIVEKRPTVWAARARTGGLRSSLLADLSQRESLKRAVVLKEVLDRPVGLRE